MFLRLAIGLTMDNDLVLAIHTGHPVIALDTPLLVFILALSLSVMLLLRGLLPLPGLSS
jgi:hypothetical protein